jgi:predicted YcjX-like family ATPase
MSEEVQTENKSLYNIDEMFAIVDKKALSKNLSLIVWGPSETGKTVFATSCPGPLRFINLDAGLHPNLKFVDENKVLQEIKCIDYTDDAKNIDAENYKWDDVNPMGSLKNFDKAVSALLENVHGGTVIVDTMSTVNDWLKALMNANVPKHVKADGTEYVDQFDWKYVNTKWKWLLDKLKSIDANLVILARAAPVYQGRDIVVGEWQPEMRDGWKYLTSVIIQLSKIDIQDPITKKFTSKRIAKFNKFRGNDLSQNYEIEDVNYNKVIEILTKENVI